MKKRITIIDGHPDPRIQRFCHAVTAAYADGARNGSHEVRILEIAGLDISMLRTRDEWENGGLPPQLKPAQDALAWAGHLVIVYPLWLGDMPAMLKAFLEQVARPEFVFGRKGVMPAPGALKGKSAHIIVTMGMPAFIYRWYFFKHSLTSLKRNMLQLAGVNPVRETIIGGVEAAPHARWLRQIRRMGMAGR